MGRRGKRVPKIRRRQRDPRMGLVLPLGSSVAPINPTEDLPLLAKKLFTVVVTLAAATLGLFVSASAPAQGDAAACSVPSTEAALDAVEQQALGLINQYRQ